MNPPRSDLRSPPPQGGAASGPAEPDPRRPLDSELKGIAVYTQAMDTGPKEERKAVRSVEEAELMAGCEIKSVYAGIAGGHIKGFNSHGVIAVKDGEVSEHDVRRVIDAAKAVASVAGTPSPTAPAAPTNLGATAISTSEIDLSWTDNATDATGYYVESCQGTGCSNFAACSWRALAVVLPPRAAALSIASAIASYIANVSAFFFSGRFIRMVRIAPSSVSPPAGAT